MTTVVRPAVSRWALPVLVAFVIATATLASVFFWILYAFERHMSVPHAIYATGQLVEAYHQIHDKTGSWPAPGSCVAKEIEFVRSYTDGAARVDIFNFGGDQYARLYLRDRTIEVRPTSGPN